MNPKLDELYIYDRPYDKFVYLIRCTNEDFDGESWDFTVVKGVNPDDESFTGRLFNLTPELLKDFTRPYNGGITLFKRSRKDE